MRHHTLLPSLLMMLNYNVTVLYNCITDFSKCCWSIFEDLLPSSSSSSSIFCGWSLSLVFLQFVSKCITNECALLDKIVAIHHWEILHLEKKHYECTSRFRGTLGEEKGKQNHCVTQNFRLKVKVDSVTANRELNFCLMSFQRHRLTSFAPLNCGPSQHNSGISCQTITWRHLSSCLWLQNV